MNLVFKFIRIMRSVHVGPVVGLFWVNESNDKFVDGNGNNIVFEIHS